MKPPKKIAKEKGAPPEASTIVLTSPTLIWPSIPDTYDDSEFDRPAAPLYPLVTFRHDLLSDREDGVPGLGCRALWSAIRSSSQILIMDTHFSKRGMISLRETLTQGTSMIDDLRVITAEKDCVQIFQGMKKALDGDGRLSSAKNIGIAVMVRNSPPWLHDRFAVTDGELWHFGGTVSGEHKLTAASRGWRADDHRFVDAFNEAWRILEGQGGVR